jgi:hypothetical protein
MDSPIDVRYRRHVAISGGRLMSRTSANYEQEARARYREWKASLNWGEYAVHQWRQWKALFAGMVTGAAVVGLIWLATR